MLDLVIGSSLGCIALMGIAVFKTHRTEWVGFIFMALLLATAGFVLHPIMPMRWQWVTTDLQTLIPSLFWLLCQFAFRERPAIAWYWMVMIGYSAIVPAVYALSPGIGRYVPLMETIFLDGPGYIEYLLIAGGLWTVVKYWPDDLVASRRRLRVAVVLMVGLTVLLNVVSVNSGWGDLLFQRFTVLTCLLVIASQIIAVPKGVLFGLVVTTSTEDVEPTAANSLPQKDDVRLTLLLNLMENGFYKKEKLTIAQLAKSVALPEYVVRSLINEQLGFRNFNDFVNQWRIEDATEQLLKQPDKPVMNIALDLGYRTLSSFNRAFKERTNKSPTQYRQESTVNRE